MEIEHFKTDFYCWFDETWSPFNLSEQILKGISIKILPISEEIDLHKFCYPEESNKGKTLWGICTKSFEQIYPPKFAEINISEDRKYMIVHYEQEKAFLTLNGKCFVRGNFDHISLPAVNVIHNKNTDNYYLYDKNWNALIPEFNDSFSEEKCSINDFFVFSAFESDIYWNVNENHKLYLIIYKYSKEIFEIELKDESVKIIKNFNEEITYTTKTESNSFSYIKFKIDEYVKGIIIDKKLYIIPNFDRIEPFEYSYKTRLFKTHKGNKIGLLSDYELLSPRYDEIKSFIWNDGSNSCYFLLYQNNLCGLYNLNKERIIIPCQYQSIEESLSGFKILDKGKWGLIDYDGKCIIKTEYEEIIEKEYNIYTRIGNKANKCPRDKIYSSTKEFQIIANFSNAYDNLDGKLLTFDCSNINLITDNDETD